MEDADSDSKVLGKFNGFEPRDKIILRSAKGGGRIGADDGIVVSSFTVTLWSNVIRFLISCLVGDCGEVINSRNWWSVGY